MGHPLKRPNQRGNRHKSPTWAYGSTVTVSRETPAEAEERERLIAEHIARRGVTRLPCLYRPLP